MVALCQEKRRCPVTDMDRVTGSGETLVEILSEIQQARDPKRGAGQKKVPINVFPPAVLLEAGAAMGEGAIKYGPHNWRTSGGVCSSTYVNGCMRHLLAWMMGEDTDPDTVAEDGSGGVSHLSKLIASAAVLRDAQLHGALHDDRPPASDPVIIKQITEAYQGLAPRARVARDELSKG